MSRETDIKATKIANQYGQFIDFDLVNKSLQLTGDNALNIELSKKTIQNISKWALNGESDNEIANNLELTNKQFQFLCQVCPVLIYVMQQSRAMADVVVAGTLFETAVGGKVVRKQVLSRVTEYDEKGKPLKTYSQPIWVEEELPPNADLLKFLAKNKLSEKFGNTQVNVDSDNRRVIENMTKEELDAIDFAIQNEKKDNN